MDCVDRRVIMWNEALCDPYFYEDVKCILSGDAPEVHIKNQGELKVFKTPVIILSNRNTFPDNEEFNSRLIKYNWKYCELLKHCKKKPNPMSFPPFSDKSKC